MKKRFVSLALALVMALSLLPAAALAAEEDFVIEDGVLTGYNGPGGDVVIPDGVTRIGDFAFAYTDLTSVTIPTGVTSIGDRAFQFCYDLASVTIPASVTSIGENAFFKCPAVFYFGGSEAQWESIGVTHDVPYYIKFNCEVSSTTQTPDAPPAYASTQPPVAPPAYASTQNVLVDGKSVEFQCYALKDASGNDTNYIKLRDIANVLNGTAVQFDVSWDGSSVNIQAWTPYTPNGSEMRTPFSDEQVYQKNSSGTKINGFDVDLDTITLQDSTGTGYTYYKLRELGAWLGFKVDWSAEKGIFIETT